MLRILGYLLKATLFAALVLVLGSWIRWDGKTISDQVKVQIAQAERSGIAHRFRSWAGTLIADAREGASKIKEADEIPASERKKLRDLIRELNGSR